MVMNLGEGLAAAETARSAGDRETALRLLEDLRAAFPGRAEPILKAAGLLAQLGRADEAEATLARGQETVPGEPLMFSDHARMAEARGDWPEALRRWNFMRERLPGYWQGYSGAAGALRALRRFDEADALLVEGQTRMADPHAMYLDYPRAAEQRGDWEEALRRWRLAYERYPGHWLANAGHISALNALGRLDEAEALGARAAEAFPDNLPVHFAWADCAIRRHRPELAAERYRRAAEHNPAHQQIRHRLIDQLLLLDRRADAEAAIAEALQKWPSDPVFLRYRIALAQRMGQFEVAFAACESLPDDGREASGVKRDLALAILTGQPPEPAASRALALLVFEPDTGDRLWLPAVARLPENAAALLKWIGTLLEKNGFDTDSPALILLRSMCGFTFSDDEILSYIKRFVATGRTALAARIFSFLYYLPKPGEKARIAAIFETYLADELARRGSGSDCDPIQFVGYLMFASVFSEPAHRMLVKEAQRVVPADDRPPADSCFDEPWEIVRSVAGAFPRGGVAPAAVAVRSRPLRVALCVSGQLRGYREAFPSWSSLGLAGHEVTIFVHTWREVGQNWARMWDFLPHDRPLREAVNGLGAGWIRNNYPILGQAIDAAMASGSTVAAAQLREFYGTEFVWVEDDRQPPFAGNTNTWKMHYKMYQAQKCAADSGRDFDLFIKIRPDQLLKRRSDIDWNALFEEARRERVIYADRGYQFTGEVIKLADQFVAGTRETMDAYTEVFTRANRCAETGRVMFDGPDFFRAHASVGFSTLYEGVLAREMPVLEFVKLLNPTIVAPAEILALLLRDTHARAPIDFDGQFIADVQAAVDRLN